MLDQKTHAAIIAAHVRRAGKEHREWDRLRGLYRCENWGKPAVTNPAIATTEAVVTETGSVFAFTDTMVASIVPPNPAVTLNPRRKSLAEIAKLREALCNYTFRYTKAGRILWKHASQASVYPRAVLKAVWHTATNKVRYIPLDPRYFFYDMTVTLWEDIRYCIEVTVITKAEFQARIAQPLIDGAKPDPRRIYDAEVAGKAPIGTYPKWLEDTSTGIAMDVGNARSVFEWVTVYELYDFTYPGGRVYHYLEGQEIPLFQGDLPYAFLRNPFHITIFNDNLEDNGGMSDAKLVEGPIRRYDEMATLEIRFAQATIPVTVLNTGLVDDVEEAENKLSQATGPWHIVGLNVKNGERIESALSHTPMAVLSPNFASAKEGLQQEIMFRLGMPAYTRGVAGQSDIATEFALIDATLKTRQGRRVGIIYDAVTFMAEAALALYEEFMPADGEIMARVADDTSVEIIRRMLQFRDAGQADKAIMDGTPIEDPLEIDIDVVPYSPVENSKAAQLQKLFKFLAVYIESPITDLPKFMKKLTELLDIGDVLKDDATIKAMQQQAAANQQAAQPANGKPGPKPGPDGSPIQQSPIDAAAGGETPETVTPHSIQVGARPGMAGGAGFSAPDSGAA